jgi:4-hydroxy-tetrahydrodipicolinate synthase
VTRCAVEVSAGRIPVLANVSETSTREALRFIKAAVELGVDGFMLMPSLIYVADSREAMQSIRTMAEAAQKPCMIYNNPVAYRVDLKPEHMAELADCKWLVAIKESSDDVRRLTDLRNALGTRYQLFIGVDDLSFEALALGAAGHRLPARNRGPVRPDEGRQVAGSAGAVSVVHATVAPGCLDQAGAEHQAGRDPGRRGQ